MNTLFPKREEDKENYDMYKKSLTLEQTPFHQYNQKITELKNMRIGSFLVDRTHNKELQQYLDSNEAQIEGDQNPQIIEPTAELSTINHQYNEVAVRNSENLEEEKRQRLTREVEEYKKELVEKERMLDLHRRKNLGRKAEFKHLTLIENLNYIKYNSRTVKHIFSIFKTTSSVIQVPNLAANVTIFNKILI